MSALDRLERFGEEHLVFLKFGFSEKATKFEENLRRTFDKSVVFCARNSVCTCQKVGEDFSKQMWSSRILQTLLIIPDPS